MSKFEVRVDDWVLTKLKELGVDYYQQHDLPDNYIKGLQGASKSGKGMGRPDFSISVMPGDKVGVVIENKWGLDKLEKVDEKGVSDLSTKFVNDYALNGAIYYANNMIESGEFDVVYALGVAGEGARDDLTVGLKGTLVRKDVAPFNFEVEGFSNFSKLKFGKFHNEMMMTEEEKHRQLELSLKDLQKSSKELNTLMNDNAITVDSRVVYVSGMLLAMKRGLKPEELKGDDPLTTTSDGKKIYNAIDSFLRVRKIEEGKRDMMLSIYTQLQTDTDRDKVRPRKTRLTGKNKGKLTTECSINKEIFEYIYDNIYVTIQEHSHLDTLGELYSEFLKYALGDGKDNGIVLTPPYATKMMNSIIHVDKDSRLLDLCTGSGGFLVSGMASMIDLAKEDKELKEDSNKLEKKIKHIKKNQLMGVEFNVKMYTLASSNMILRGDGSSTLIKGDAFEAVKLDEVIDFKANKALLNPPFSYSENGMPFALIALEVMEKDGLLAIIIQDSAGTGRSIKTNKEILKNHTLVSSIKMPGDLFQPSAGVQTSVYVLKAHVPHDFKQTVKLIDFSDDGYKRTGRGLSKKGNPEQKYKDILEIYEYGVRADNYDSSGIDYIEDVITDSGADWNYTQHKVIDTTATEEDFMKTVGDYLSWEVKTILEGRGA